MLAFTIQATKPLIQPHIVNMTDKSDPKDRRTHTRHSCSLKVGYATMDLSFIDFITDINCWGVFIQSSKRVPVGESVSMTIPLHGDGESIQVIGEVMWSSPQGMGVKFNMGFNTSVLSSLLK